MKTFRHYCAVVVFAFVFVGVSIGDDSPKLPDNYPKLVAPDESDPRFAVYLAWHRAVLANDFESYERFSYFPASSIYTEDMKRSLLGEIRKLAPDNMKVGETKESSTGGLQFTAVGCKDSKRYVSSIIILKVEGKWQVSGSAWGPPWNSSRDICPV